MNKSRSVIHAGRISEDNTTNNIEIFWACRRHKHLSKDLFYLSAKLQYKTRERGRTRGFGRRSFRIIRGSMQRNYIHGYENMSLDGNHQLQ